MTGERIPNLNSNARGCFFGLTLQHDASSMVRAIMEGVTYTLRDKIERLNKMGIKTKKIIASGGGANSNLWMQIQADVYDCEVYRSNMAEQACVGAAITAGVGCGVYDGIEDACSAIVKISDQPVLPQKINVEIYESSYMKYKALCDISLELFDVINN